VSGHDQSIERRTAADGSEVQASLDRVSAVVQRALIRVMAHEERARCAATETLPRKGRAAGAPLPTAQTQTSTSLTDTPQRCREGEARVG
jgi:hypothetical protein